MPPKKVLDSPMYPLLHGIQWKAKPGAPGVWTTLFGHYAIERYISNIEQISKDWDGPRLYRYGIISGGKTEYTTDNADYMEYQLQRLTANKPPSR